MRVAIAGAHGQIARLLARRLAVRGDEVVGLVRNPDHLSDVECDGARGIVCDLEHAGPDAVAAALAGCDAAVFAAGAGAGSGSERKLTMDRDGVLLLLGGARRAGVERFVVVSAVGAEDPPDDDEVFSVYLRAKAEADRAVEASDRTWTIVRPGRLTDGPGTGRVRLDRLPYRGEVPRADVAAVLARILTDPRAAEVVLYVNGGETPIGQALDDALYDALDRG